VDPECAADCAEDTHPCSLWIMICYFMYCRGEHPCIPRAHAIVALPLPRRSADHIRDKLRWEEKI
jgi:hypothetical protein